MSNDRLARLEKYADGLRTRLSGGVPEKHKHRPAIFKDMIQRDLDKTLAMIEKLRK